jgi:sec-independent protein translocase protein TatC
VFRFGFPFFLEMNGPDVTAVLSINSYLTFATTLLVAFGVAFQLPVVIFFLARLGIVNHRDLVRGFRYSIVAIAVVAAILTPPDVVSMSLMAVPLVVLYGLGIGVAWLWSTKPIPTG